MVHTAKPRTLASEATISSTGYQSTDACTSSSTAAMTVARMRGTISKIAMSPARPSPIMYHDDDSPVSTDAKLMSPATSRLPSGATRAAMVDGKDGAGNEDDQARTDAAREE